MSKHTAGPWVFGILSWGEGVTQEIEEKPFDYSGPGYYANPSIMDKNGTEIVGCDEYNIFSSPENTRLMVAAPDLLEALEMAEAMLCRLEPIVDRGEDDSISVEIEILAARAAIAKARGEA